MLPPYLLVVFSQKEQSKLVILRMAAGLYNPAVRSLDSHHVEMMPIVHPLSPVFQLVKPLQPLAVQPLRTAMVPFTEHHLVPILLGLCIRIIREMASVVRLVRLGLSILLLLLVLVSVRIV